MSKVRICFLGTPAFAVVSLKKLIDDEHYEIVGVVTQPDRPSGRKLQLTPSPVKTLALQHGLKVLSPESVNKDNVLTEIQELGAEVAVVVAFGQILSTRFLGLFPFGAVNVHGSILPRWRGAAPIQRALESGDTQTGVTLQKVVKELDAGDIIGIRKIDLDENINAIELHDEMAQLGADLLHIELMDYVKGHLVPQPQEQQGITYAKKIEKSESAIDWNKPAREIHNKIRAFLMGPGTFAQVDGKRLKIHRSQVVDEQKIGSGGKLAGEILKMTGDQLWMQTGKGVLALLEVQPESKNKMKIADFLKGLR